MEIAVLGPLTASQSHTSIVPTAGKPRQILALLALHAGRMVTVPTLMEEIWGEDMPRSASTTLQTYILQLRRKIATALSADAARQDGGGQREAKDVLTTWYGGYRLDVPAGSVDVQDFERLAAQGRTAHELGDHRAASDLLGRALEMWRGPALVDVRVGPVLELEVLRLEELRTSTLERRIDADLRLGRHAELLGELHVLTKRHPMHEGFCGQLMLAYYRAGSAWRALDAYQRLRGTLVEELGIEPSPRTQQLQHAILAGEPWLDLSDAPGVPGAGLRSVAGA
ncbi:AfsR/SARP family transcriptional regulator [Streptomyces sp. ET3-23]|uniref:AfsR/SARP family transcriptional regulator n=1 Tax=Streptomyces sp. ET3-23 TaxID=2885643 RepID=UPI001D1242D4|nr:AfsR/SARP family transcriptional regulator [Streptomyces sp. ET3-23]MCC2274755.1 AfsR/SARP family transcriptional regulator [Streptomyces sp. ET3-23]